jgi:hypothetical protein
VKHEGWRRGLKWAVVEMPHSVAFCCIGVGGGGAVDFFGLFVALGEWNAVFGVVVGVFGFVW